jgi:hypothetical protein
MLEGFWDLQSIRKAGYKFVLSRHLPRSIGSIDPRENLTEACTFIDQASIYDLNPGVFPPNFVKRFQACKMVNFVFAFGYNNELVTLL